MKTLNVAMCLLLGAALSAHAQQPANNPVPTPPSQAGGSQSGAAPAVQTLTPLQPEEPLYQGDANQQGGVDQQSQIKPDNTPLSGILDMTLGTPENQRRNFFVPSIRFAQSLESQPAAGNPGDLAWRGRSNLGANVHFEHSLLPGGRVQYNGIATWDSAQNDGVRQYQQFGIMQSFSLRRWHFTAVDEGSYSPSSSFGYAGLEGFGTPVGGLNQMQQFGPGSSLLRSSMFPDQSIMQDNAPRISNTSALEVQYDLTARSSVTMNGNYGLMRGIGSSIVDSDQYGAGGGYNYRLSARTMVGVQYGFASLTFPGNGRNIVTHSIEGGFARKVTGRLAWSTSLGAEFVDIADPAMAEFKTVSLGGDTNLTYTRGRHQLTLAAYRHVSNGSGVFAGAKTSAVQGSVAERLSQRWSLTFNGGYAHNTSFDGRGFNTLFTGMILNRQIGRYTGVFLNYNVAHQTPIGVCTGLLCDSQYRHVFSIGFNWSYRPIPVF